MRTNYVVTTYFGNRRTLNQSYSNDGLYYLKVHLRYLMEVKHSLDTITIVCNMRENEPDQYRSYINRIPKKIQNANVIVHTRPNLGMSYSAFNEIVKSTIGEYDYYFWNEDDYYFINDNFDTELINKFESLESPGFLCGLIRNNPCVHAGYQGGITSKEVMKNALDSWGDLPHSQDSDYHNNEMQGNIDQTHKLLELGYNLYDMRDTYRFPMCMHGNIEWHFLNNSKYNLVPIQILEKTNFINPNSIEIDLAV